MENNPVYRPEPVKEFVTHFVEGVRVWKGNEKANGTRDRWDICQLQELNSSAYWFRDGVSLIFPNYPSHVVKSEV